jgi:hypothetical protein
MPLRFSVFSFDPNCGRAIPIIRLVSASNNIMNFNIGLPALTLGISTDRISFCPNKASDFFRLILEYQKKTINAGMTNKAYKYSGFAILNILYKFQVPNFKFQNVHQRTLAHFKLLISD